MNNEMTFNFSLWHLNIFFQGDRTLSRKNCPEKPHRTAGVHRRATQCKQTPQYPILRKSGKGRHVYVRAWAENIANAWLPIQTLSKVP
jgi:hypothetical protein